MEFGRVQGLSSNCREPILGRNRLAGGARLVGWPWLLRRAGASVLLLLFTSIVIFVLLRVIPGDPTSVKLGLPGVTKQQVVEMQHSLGLDRSILAQYLSWVGDALRGHLGSSYFSGFSATTLIGQAVVPSLELAFASMVLVVLLAIPASLTMVVYPRSLARRLLSLYASAGMSMPAFWLGILLIQLFSIRLGWLPSRGYASFTSDPVVNLRFLTLPAITLAVVLSAPVIRFLHVGLEETIGAEFIRTARGKGLLWREIAVRHALPNGLLPTLNFVGVLTGSLLGGVVIIEWVFGWPGLGALAVQAVSTRDYPVLQGVVLLASAAFILVTLAVDLFSMLLDPRLRV